MEKKNVSSHQKLLLNLKQRVDCKWARDTTENGTGISEQTVKLVEEVWKHICVSPKKKCQSWENHSSIRTESDSN